ncbi:Pentatricopeptide repeat-containing protein [Ananas comosus]|uniref:Pentatricopeptide repeat-containing protein n=1 Tax=Ananas comosus TaxID=4615 RepID=A0A199UCW2_ANACO|nr:Pentatricopeptide repeat-containing protein [Ananas comosus]
MPLSSPLPIPATNPTPLSQQTPPKRPHYAISLLKLIKTHKELSQLHSHLIKANLLTNPFTYNSLIKSYSRAGDPNSALSLFLDIINADSAAPDGFTYTFVLNVCAKSSYTVEGKQIHARMVKDPKRINTYSWNSLMGFYVKNGEDVWRVRRVLDGMRDPDVVSWNCLLDGYVKVGNLEAAQQLFDEMPVRDIVSWTTMLVGFADNGLLRNARHLFDGMPERNMVSWSVMIKGFVKAGMYKEALALFKEMQVSNVKIDKITLTTLLSACAGSGALDQGRWVHAYIDRHKIEVDAHLSTALVDMYAKCGKVDLAYSIFKDSKDKEVFSWNAMLGGLAMHSRGDEAIELFREMLSSGIEPNEITFICVLSACSHSGLVEDGLKIFNTIDQYRNVRLSKEHYVCVVDLLARAGLLKHALKVVVEMPMKADGNVWRALLSACHLYGNVEMSEYVGRVLLEMEPTDDGNYIILFNLYASRNRWDEVGRLRKMMVERRVRKTPGCSLIEVEGVVHTFLAGDCSHSQSGVLRSLVDELIKQCYPLTEIGHE